MKLATRDDSLNLIGILRHHLPKAFPAFGSDLSADEQRQLDEAKDKLLSELVLGHDAETRKVVFATEAPVIEGFLSGYTARTAMAWLGIAFMVFVIVDKALHAQLPGCTRATPREEYFSYAAPRLKIEASTLSNLYKEGSTFEDMKFLLLCGTGDVPGVTLDFVAENRTKLLDLAEAAQRHTPREALLHYRNDTSRDFAVWAKYTEPTATSSNADGRTPEQIAEDKAKADARKTAAKDRAAARRQKMAEIQATIDAEVAMLPEDEKFIIRTFQAGMVPYIAQAPIGRPEFLDELPSRLIANRERLLREVKARTQGSDFNPNDSVNLADGLGRVGSIFEAEERISSAVTSLAEHKRAVCILAYRLHNEPTLIQEWQGLGFSNLQAYAAARLGIGPEIYTYSKIGRALIRYSYLIAELPDHDSEGFFKMMEHVERAIQTHKGDSAAVEHALRTLSPEDFKEFSRKADFKEREFSKPVTQAQLDQVYEYRSMIRHYQRYGNSPAMRLVALVDRDESRYVHVIFAQMETELAEAPVALSTEPIVLPAPTQEPDTVDADATFEYAIIDEVA